MTLSTIKWLGLATASALFIGMASIFITESQTDCNCSNPVVLETLRRSKLNELGLTEDRFAPEALNEAIEKVRFYLIRTLDKRLHGYTCTAVIHVPSWKPKESSVDKGVLTPETDYIRDYTIKFTDDGRFVLYVGENLKKHH